MSPSETERGLNTLEAELRRLEAEYNMFFAGRLPKPPWEMRSRVEVPVKQYDHAHIPNTGDRFRFTTLQSRYASFVDLWDRRMRAREEGRAGPFQQKRTKLPKKEKEAKDRVAHVDAFKDPAREMDKLTVLYTLLSAAWRAVGEDRYRSTDLPISSRARWRICATGAPTRWRFAWRSRMER